MPLPFRFVIFKICQQNLQHGRFISLFTAALRTELRAPFRRFFASNSSATSGPSLYIVTDNVKTTIKTYVDKDGWHCPNCDHLNWRNRRFCKKCTVGKPIGSPRWVCSSCKWANIPTHCSCQKCVKGRPTEEQRQLIQKLRWVCGICKHHNFTDECFKCSAPKSKGLLGGVGGESLSDGSWYCISCWFLNFPNFSRCRQCREGVPTDDQRIAIQNSRWGCVDCGAFNYSPSSTCFKCQAMISSPFHGTFPTA